RRTPYARIRRVAAAPSAGDEKRLLDLQEEVAPLVRGRAVDAEADAHARVAQRPPRGDARAEAEVRGRTVRHARSCAAEPRHLVVGEVHAVRAPDVAIEPAEPVEVLDAAAALHRRAI